MGLEIQSSINEVQTIDMCFNSKFKGRGTGEMELIFSMSQRFCTYLYLMFFFVFSILK